MKGIELAEKYYEAFGKDMLSQKFSAIKSSLAIGILGGGSECLGFDDEISTDHDFEPAFCIFVNDAIDDKTFFELEREYAKLPDEFLGYKRNKFSAVGGNRHGVIRISDFLLAKIGSKTAELSLDDWFFIPEQALLEATSGKIFCDESNALVGKLSRLSYLPEDVRLKKLAGNLLMMAQSGQYNYERVLKRGDTAASQLAVIEFVKATLNVVFLLNKKYIPYYKWTFRALAGLPILSSMKNDLEFLISSDNKENAQKKVALIEDICKQIGLELVSQDLLKQSTAEMEEAAYLVNGKIKDNNIRNLHILYAL